MSPIGHRLDQPILLKNLGSEIEKKMGIKTEEALKSRRSLASKNEIATTSRQRRGVFSTKLALSGVHSILKATASLRAGLCVQGDY